MHREAKHARRARAVARSSKIVEQPSPVDDPRGPMGIRLLPLTEGASHPLRPGGPCLLVPTDAGVDELRVGPARHTVDRASFALLAAGARATVETRSPVSHLLLLTVDGALARKLVAAYRGEIDPRRLDGHLRTTQVLPRTNWLNEVYHRYLFERAVCKKRNNEATRFLELEMVKELYFLCEARAGDRDRASVVEAESPLLQRALRAIEARLFEPEVLRTLPRACGASPSTLLRAFKRELGHGPIVYVRSRRLDESLLLLKSRRYSVSEVASLVGYRNFAAFSQAFRARFGIRPSEVRPR
jgi:AraC-like DNA-binding protein